MRAKIHVVAALSGVLLAGAGCAEEQDKAKVASNGSSTAKAQSRADAQPTTGRVAHHAAQIRVSEELAKEGSASATALTLVRDVRDGAGPVLLPAYDSRIPERVGISHMIGALDHVRQLAQQTTPVVVRQRRATSGQLVVLRLLRKEGEDSTHAFLLRRQGGRWVIAYDSLLAEGLQAYVQGARANNPATPSRAARRAGARAALELKLAARTPLARPRPEAKKPPTETTPSAP